MNIKRVLHNYKNIIDALEKYNPHIIPKEPHLILDPIIRRELGYSSPLKFKLFEGTYKDLRLQIYTNSNSDNLKGREKIIVYINEHDKHTIITPFAFKTSYIRPVELDCLKSKIKSVHKFRIKKIYQDYFSLFDADYFKALTDHVNDLDDIYREIQKIHQDDFIVEEHYEDCKYIYLDRTKDYNDQYIIYFAGTIDQHYGTFIGLFETVSNFEPIQAIQRNCWNRFRGILYNKDRIEVIEFVNILKI